MEMKFLMTSPKQKILTNKWQKTFSNKSLKVSLRQLSPFLDEFFLGKNILLKAALRTRSYKNIFRVELRYTEIRLFLLAD